MLKILIPAAIILLSGCGNCPTVEPVSLPIPVNPVLPKIQPDELRCLELDTYSALVERDSRLQAAFGECRAIIESTH